MVGSVERCQTGGSWSGRSRDFLGYLEAHYRKRTMGGTFYFTAQVSRQPLVESSARVRKSASGWRGLNLNMLDTSYRPQNPQFQWQSHAPTLESDLHSSNPLPSVCQPSSPHSPPPPAPLHIFFFKIVTPNACSPPGNTCKAPQTSGLDMCSGVNAAVSHSFLPRPANKHTSGLDEYSQLPRSTRVRIPFVVSW